MQHPQISTCPHFAVVNHFPCTEWNMERNDLQSNRLEFILGGYKLFILGFYSCFFYLAYSLIHIKITPEYRIN